MQELNIYFNELCVPLDLDPASPPQWREYSIGLVKGLQKAAQHNQSTRVLIQPGQWHLLVAGRPLFVWLKEWLSRLDYRWLLGRLRLVEADHLEVDLFVNGTRGSGLAMSHVRNTWGFSLPFANAGWVAPVVHAVEHKLVGEEIVETPCDVRHISVAEHADHWRQELEDWDVVIADTNIIAEIDGKLIVMFPLDHTPPHFHLVLPASGVGRRKTIAKYRFDVFERLEGPDNWDTPVRAFAQANMESLNRSWKRCQKGDHPIRLDQ